MHVSFHTSLRGGAIEIRAHQACERGCSKVGGTPRIEEGAQESWGALINCKGIYFKATIQGKVKGKQGKEAHQGKGHLGLRLAGTSLRGSITSLRRSLDCIRHSFKNQNRSRVQPEPEPEPVMNWSNQFQ